MLPSESTWQARGQEQPNELRVTVPNLQCSSSQRVAATRRHSAIELVSRELHALGNGTNHYKSVLNIFQPAKCPRNLRPVDVFEERNVGQLQDLQQDRTVNEKQNKQVMTKCDCTLSRTS